jgi:multiple sugar transport system permease protein
MYGTINTLRSFFFGLEPVTWLDESHVVGSIIFMEVLMGFGVPMLLYVSSIKAIPEAYYEAAEVDGANRLQQFIHITLPQVSPVSFYILVTGLIGSLQGFTVYQVMTNGNPSNTMMPVLLIYKYSGGDYGAFYGYASAMAIVLGAIIVVLTSLEFVLSKKWVYYES